MSLDSLMDSLTSLSDVGDCVARVEHLLQELKTLEERAQVSQHTHTHTCYIRPSSAVSVINTKTGTLLHGNLEKLFNVKAMLHHCSHQNSWCQLLYVGS